MPKIIAINPTTEKVYGDLEEDSEDKINQTINNAKSDYSWSKKSINDRVEIIKKLANLLLENKENIARVMANEMGKPLKASRHEIEIAVKRIQDFCRLIPDFIKDEILFEDDKEKNVVVFEPLGIVVVISPWNAPVFVPLASIIPALLCGNNVIWKPSEYSSFTGLELDRLFNILKENDLPKYAFQTIIGSKDVGKKLVESNIDMIALTGSIKAGKEVIRNSAEKMHKFVLELGGKDPTIILKDADIDEAAKAIVKSSTMYTGQVCFAVERVYCHESIYDKFVEKCVEETKKIIIGNPLDENTDIGPFAVKFQMNKVIEHIDDAISKGAKLIYGGEKIFDSGYFMQPGVIINVNHNMKIMKEETFGPITPIMKFSNEEEAIRLANDSIYGLTASIWTKNKKRGEEIAKMIEAGTVEINRHGMSKAGCPWGGYKQSGIGRIYSKEGIREFTNIKHIWVIK